MTVCALTHGATLEADYRGGPFILHAGYGLRPAGYCSELHDFTGSIFPDWAGLIEHWQADPKNDVLRARGDLRWQAACSAVAILKAGGVS